MSVRDLLRKALDKLGNGDFGDFKWHLSDKILEGCEPIPSHCLEDAKRKDTVSELTKRYGDKAAVNITVKVLEKMNHKPGAEALEKDYAELAGAAPPVAPPAASSAAPSAAAAQSIRADNGSVVFMPNVSGASGPWTVTINKSS